MSFFHKGKSKYLTTTFDNKLEKVTKLNVDEIFRITERTTRLVT